MFYAAGSDNPIYLKLLINKGGNPNIIEDKFTNEKDLARRTPLTETITFNSKTTIDRIKLLVKAGADINYSNIGNPFYTQSALAKSISLDQLEVTNYLLEIGADYNEIMYTTVDNDTIKILGALRTSVYDLDSKNYNYKQKIILFLKNKGLDYNKEPIPDYIEKKIKKDYPKNWETMLKNY